MLQTAPLAYSPPPPLLPYLSLNPVLIFFPASSSPLPSPVDPLLLSSLSFLTSFLRLLLIHPPVTPFPRSHLRLASFTALPSFPPQFLQLPSYSFLSFFVFSKLSCQPSWHIQQIHQPETSFKALKRSPSPRHLIFSTNLTASDRRHTGQTRTGSMLYCICGQADETEHRTSDFKEKKRLVHIHTVFRSNTRGQLD